jgi:hypothetical protein
MGREVDDDPIPWRDVLIAVYLALAMFGIGGFIVFVWSIVK